jgi:hypothetical protein
MRKKNLGPKAFEKIFGFKPRRPLRGKRKEKADNINQLFDDMDNELSMGSWEIFQKALPKERAYVEHSRFLQDVTTCSRKVVSYCQCALAPGSKIRQKIVLQKGREDVH